MNILYLAYADWAGVGYRCYEAINDTFDEHTAQHVCYHDHRMKFPRQHFRPGPKKLDELVDWADVIHGFDDWQRFRKQIRGNPLVVTYNGTWYRRNVKNANLIAKKRGAVQLCTTVDLCKLGPEWMPIPMKDHGVRMRVRGDKPWRLVHAPSKPAIKGTEFVKSAMKNLPDIEFDLIQNVSNKECIRRKAQGDILHDEFVLGYGVNAMESWWIGQVVVSGIEDQWVANRMVEEIGYIPFVRTTKAKFVQTIRRLTTDHLFYEESRQLGIEYINNFHQPSSVAEKLVGVYGRLT
jgi:hypothetical protein